MSLPIHTPHIAARLTLSPHALRRHLPTLAGMATAVTLIAGPIVALDANALGADRDQGPLVELAAARQLLPEVPRESAVRRAVDRALLRVAAPVAPAAAAAGDGVRSIGSGAGPGGGAGGEVGRASGRERG